MKYISTRGGVPPVDASRAIYKGLAEDGGLYVPQEIPAFPKEDFLKLGEYSYQELACKIFGLYLNDFTPDEIEAIVTKAYGENFDDAEVVPLHEISGNRYIMELWHGPTAAFKDVALQILPHFLTASIQKQKSDNEVVILVATSGDTGKAALEGFADVPGTKIIVFYPNGGVSEIQRLQMATQTGDNTFVCAINGNFDDCQRGVKEIFANEDFNYQLNQRGYELSSANSINWGRLLPQIVYYFKSYGSLIKKGAINCGDEFDVVVPTGNFGNILACYYAKRMGLPVRILLCASNENKILTDVIRTGTYDKRREFFRTSSPSMDILVSSNFERFVFELVDHDSRVVSGLFSDLDTKGIYQLPQDALERLKTVLEGEYATEAETIEEIGSIYQSDEYVVDPHTAVALKSLAKWDAVNKRDDIPCVIDSTANPYKFNKPVFEGIFGKGSVGDMDEFEVSDTLEQKTGMEIHRGLKNLQQREIRHRMVSEKTGMIDVINNFLK